MRMTADSYVAASITTVEHYLGRVLPRDSEPGPGDSPPGSVAAIEQDPPLIYLQGYLPAGSR
jgi:hypothetical protein